MDTSEIWERLQNDINSIKGLTDQQHTIGPDRHKLLGHWSNSLAIQRVYETEAYLKSRFGKDMVEWPIVDSRPSGFVIWKNVPGIGGGIWEKWRINDDYVIHHKPADAIHADFFYMGVFVTPRTRSMWNDVLKISDSINLDRRYNIVEAGCHFRGAGVATLSLVIEYLEGMITLDQAINSYDGRIKLLASEQQKVDEEFAIFVKNKHDINKIKWEELTPLTDAFEKYILTITTIYKQ